MDEKPQDKDKFQIEGLADRQADRGRQPFSF
jgi:hypothetical protein